MCNQPENGTALSRASVQRHLPAVIYVPIRVQKIGKKITKSRPVVPAVEPVACKYI